MEAKSSLSLLRRIRSAKSSLENAEQSFKDNQSMRGELDLMLAEAELKTLRKKSSLPWNWNRQILALSAACLLVLAGFGGWCWARGGAKVTAGVPAAASQSERSVTAVSAAKKSGQAVVPDNETAVAEEKDASAGLSRQTGSKLSQQEMRLLVRDARAWLLKGSR